MMTRAARLVALMLALAAVVACGNTTSEKGKSEPPIMISTCGDGVIDSGETCDPGIDSGDGACPTTCPSVTACSVGELVGSPDSCNATCSVRVIETCVDDDGCCPAACDDTTDNDCSATCGDGVIDDGETCDGDCGTCDSSDACREGIATGSADNCSLECAFEPITACQDDDGCCPSGCDESTDSDCLDTCGDGDVVAGEVCDGNCPTSCDDGDACTIDGSSGSASLCNKVCTHQEITACQDGDGCCAAGCTSANDDDCTCTPRSCADIGATCGDADDGCGGTLSCGTCSGARSCQNNTCVDVPVGSIGDACDADDNCPVDCADTGDFKDGFCTQACDDDFDCTSGSHCIEMPGYQDTFCAPNCQADNDCRSDGYGCWDVDYDNTKECAPRAQGNAQVGAACDGLYQCAAHLNVCAQGFADGYCTRECFFNGECPSGSVCMTNPDGPGFCAALCEQASECRSQYDCAEVSNDVTGETLGVCLEPT